jgi:hypothetical protein
MSSKIWSLVVMTTLVASVLAVGTTGAQGAATPSGVAGGGSTGGQPLENHTMHVNLAKAMRRQAQAAPPRRAPKAPASRGPAVVRATDPAISGPAGSGASRSRKAAKKDDTIVAFDGLGSEEWGDSWWPSLSMDVGPEHVAQVVNSSIGVFSKTGTLMGAEWLDEFFAAADTNDACEPADTEFLTEPQVIYDSMHDRWIVGVNASVDEWGPYYYCLAVSSGGDPLNTDWRVVSKQLMPGGGDDKPYPYSSQLGIWTDGIYLAYDRYCEGDQISCGPGWDPEYEFSGPQAWAFNLADLLSGDSVRNQTYSGTNVLGASNPLNPQEATSLIPATVRKQSGLPPGGRNAYFLAVSPSVWRVNIYRWAVNWNTPANSRFTGTGAVDDNEESVCESNLAANPPNYGNCSFFPEGADYELPDDFVPVAEGNPLDSGWDYLMPRVVYSNIDGQESLWATNAGAEFTYPWKMGIKYYEIKVNGNESSLEMDQAENFWTGPDDDDLFRWMPSLAVDKNRNVGIVYTASSEDELPSVRFAGHMPGSGSDYLGAIGEGLLAQSTGFQCCVFDDEFETVNTYWGPNGSASLDPDGCTIWGSHEYLTAEPTEIDENEWNTIIGAFRFPDCTPSLLTTALTSVNGQGSEATGLGRLSATLKATGTDSSLKGKTVVFTLDGDEVGSAQTNASGVATLTGVDISEFEQGSYPNIVEANFGAVTAYSGSSTMGTLTIVENLLPQTINFPAIPNKNVNSPDFNVSATATSGLPVSFSADGPCTVTGTLVHITGDGLCTITASQAGDEEFDPAPDEDRAFDISKLAQTITFNAPAKATYGAKNLNLTATATSGLGVTFSATGPCQIVGGNAVQYTGAGDCVVKANQAGNATYAAAPHVSKTIKVAKAKSGTSIKITPTTVKNNGKVKVAVTVVNKGGSGAKASIGGKVTITVNKKSVGTGTVKKGKVTVQVKISGTPGKKVKVQALYGGDTNFAASKSKTGKVGIAK